MFCFFHFTCFLRRHDQTWSVYRHVVAVLLYRIKRKQADGQPVVSRYLFYSRPWNTCLFLSVNMKQILTSVYIYFKDDWSIKWEKKKKLASLSGNQPEAKNSSSAETIPAWDLYIKFFQHGFTEHKLFLFVNSSPLISLYSWLNTSPQVFVSSVCLVFCYALWLMFMCFFILLIFFCRNNHIQDT